MVHSRQGPANGKWYIIRKSVGVEMISASARSCRMGVGRLGIFLTSRLSNLIDSKECRFIACSILVVEGWTFEDNYRWVLGMVCLGMVCLEGEREWCHVSRHRIPGSEVDELAGGHVHISRLWKGSSFRNVRMVVVCEGQNIDR